MSNIRDNQTNHVIEKQLTQVLSHIDEVELEHVVLAYEPIWAIGTGLSATAEHANHVHQACRELVYSYNQSAAEEMPILYGGSVNSDNAEQFFSMSDIDGALVGGASLQLQSFLEIYKQFIKH